MFGPEEELDRGERKGRWAKREKRKRGERGLGFLFLFLNLFKLLNLNSFQNLNTSSLFQNFQNNLKTFKTSHKQTIKPCIQIMMHKHLLLLNYLNDI
jgi:hypothetical protein